jgi:hypothetical protein
MLPIGPTTQVLVMHEPVSFRSGIDRTVAIARLVLQKEPMDGAMFVFRNKNRIGQCCVSCTMTAADTGGAQITPAPGLFR